MHPDLKLGAVLLGALLLLSLGRVDYVFPELLHRFDLSGATLGLVFSVGGMGGALATIGTAVWVDRRGPHPVMALGAAVIAVGTLLFLAAFNLPSALIASFVRGVGSAGVVSLLVYAVIAKGAVRHRGLLIGAVVAVGTSRRFGIGDEVAQSMGVPLGVVFGALIALAAAALLYKVLPRVFDPDRQGPDIYREPAGLGTLLSTPGFWRVALPLLAASILITALGTTSSLYMPSLLRDSLKVGDSGIWFGTASALGAILAVLVGAATDRCAARTLLVGAAVIACMVTLFMLALDGWPRTVGGSLLFGIYRSTLSVLPWVLLASLLTVRHYATVAVGGALLATAFGSFAPPFVGLAVDKWGVDVWSIAWQLPLVIALFLVALWIPRRRLVHEPTHRPNQTDVSPT